MSILTPLVSQCALQCYLILQSEDVDQDCWLNVVEQEKLWSSPNQEIIPEITTEMFSRCFQ